MLTVVYGTRPEAIKLSPVVEALRARKVPLQILATGQHTDLLRGTPAEDGMAPDIQCGIPGQTDPLAYAALVEGHLRHRWVKDHPSLVVVQGDTASAYAAAQAAYALEIPIAHVEAGIRSGDEQDPWPEEGFRVAVDGVAKLKFCPTPHTMTVIRDGYRFSDLVRWEGGLDAVTGNPGIDALYSHTQPVAVDRRKDWMLVTLHRRESFGAPLTAILQGLWKTAQQYPHLAFVWPVHPNPRVMEASHAATDHPFPKNVDICSPFTAVQFGHMLAEAQAVITDSGGVQEEAAALGIPCIVCRDKTDRPESVTAGLAKVVGRTVDSVPQGLEWALDPSTPRTPSTCFGDGHAAPRIAEHLLST